MKKVLKVFSFVILGSALISAQSTPQPSAGAGKTAPAPNTTVNPAPQSQLIRILTPVAGQPSPSNSIELRFQLTNPGASAGSPNFQLQLDGQDPITTTSTEHTFTGLAPGTHTINVVLVDANGTPVMGGSATVQFTVKSPAAAPTGSVSREHAPSLDAPVSNRAAIDDDVPSQPSSNGLPLLSLIGFGVLIGGVASAFKTRE